MLLAHTKYGCRWRLAKFLEANRQGVKTPGTKRLGGELDLWRNTWDKTSRGQTGPVARHPGFIMDNPELSLATIFSLALMLPNQIVSD